MNELETAYRYIGTFYNKILLVNLAHDSFTPIKVDSHELNSIPSTITFTRWVEDFIKSPFFNPHGVNRHKQEFEQYYDLEFLRSRKTPLVLEYQKLINGDYHDMELVFLPIGSDLAYLYVRDNTKMTKSLDAYTNAEKPE